MRKTRTLAFALIALFSVQACVMLVQAARPVSPSQATSVDVLVLMQEENDPFKVRLELDQRFNITWAYNTTYQSKGAHLATYDVIIVCGFLPNNATFLTALVAAVNGGVGLFFWGGYYPVLAVPTGDIIKNVLPVTFNEPFTVEEEFWIDQNWVGQIELKVNEAIKYNEDNPNDVGFLQRNVVWESSPLVRERIYVADATVDARVLVYRPDRSRALSGNIFKEGEPLVAFRQQNAGRVLWVSMAVGNVWAVFSRYETSGVGPYWNRTVIAGTEEDHSKECNKPFYLWPYFNFFLYQSAMYLAKQAPATIDTYALWPYSPIPHAFEATLWMIFVAGLWVFNFVLFFTLGRKKKLAREISPPPAAAGTKAEPEGDGGDGARELAQDATPGVDEPDASGDDEPLLVVENGDGDAPKEDDNHDA